MKKSILLAVSLFAAVIAFGQTQHKYNYIAASFQPQYTFRFSNSESVKRNDSLSTSEKNRLGYSVFLQYQKELGKNTTLQIGLQYTNTGFVKVVSNLTPKTVIHPDLEPLDQTILTIPSPTAELNYVFDYLDIPALLNRRVYFNQKKSKHWEFFVSYGASLNFLLQDRVAVRLKGFTIDNDRSFNLKNTYLRSNFANISGMLGFRGSYNYSNKLGFITQPMLTVPLFNTTSGDLKYRLLSVGVNVGFFYNLDVKGEEEVIE